MTQQESGTDENHNRYKSSKKVNQESVSRPLVDALNHGKGSDHNNGQKNSQYQDPQPTYKSSEESGVRRARTFGACRHGDQRVGIIYTV